MNGITFIGQSGASNAEFETGMSLDRNVLDGGGAMLFDQGSRFEVEQLIIANEREIVGGPGLAGAALRRGIEHHMWCDFRWIDPANAGRALRNFRTANPF